MVLNWQNVTFDGQQNIGRIRSSDWAEHGFYTRCGSNLFYHLIERSDYLLAAGL